jgi:hypothetical protein
MKKTSCLTTPKMKQSACFKSVLCFLMLMFGLTVSLNCLQAQNLNALKNVAKSVSNIAPEKDFGWNDGIHEKYQGQVVFSKTPILYQQGREDQLSKSFVFGTDDIFFRAYFSTSFKNRAIKDGKGHMVVQAGGVSPHYIANVMYWEVNGERVGYNAESHYKYPVQYDDEMVTKWTGQSFPNHSLTKCACNNLQRSFNCYVVPKLKQGENTVKMIVNFELSKSGESLSYTPTPSMAAGEFSINLKNVADIKKHFDDINYMGKSTFYDADVVKDLKAYLSKEEVVAVVFSGTGWQTKTELGAIKSRTTPVYVVTKEDGILLARGYTAEQPHLGGGKYASTVPYINTSTSFEVPEIMFK